MNVDGSEVRGDARPLLAELAGECFAQAAVLGFELGVGSSEGFELVPEGIVGGPLGAGRGDAAGLGARLAERVDEGTQVSLAVEPRPRDAGGAGDGAHVDRISGGVEAAKRGDGASSGVVVAASGGRHQGGGLLRSAHGRGPKSRGRR